MTKQRLTPLSSLASVILYLAAGIYAGGYLLHTLHLFAPSISTPAFWCIYACFTAMLPVSYRLPTGNLAKCVGVFGMYWLIGDNPRFVAVGF